MSPSQIVVDHLSSFRRIAITGGLSLLAAAAFSFGSPPSAFARGGHGGGHHAHGGQHAHQGGYHPAHHAASGMRNGGYSARHGGRHHRPRYHYRANYYRSGGAYHRRPVMARSFWRRSNGYNTNWYYQRMRARQLAQFRTFMTRFDLNRDGLIRGVERPAALQFISIHPSARRNPFIIQAMRTPRRVALR